MINDRRKLEAASANRPFEQATHGVGCLARVVFQDMKDLQRETERLVTKRFHGFIFLSPIFLSASGHFSESAAIETSSKKIKDLSFLRSVVRVMRNSRSFHVNQIDNELFAIGTREAA
jgi:hypothetical protein